MKKFMCLTLTAALLLTGCNGKSADGNTGTAVDRKQYGPGDIGSRRNQSGNHGGSDRRDTDFR